VDSIRKLLHVLEKAIVAVYHLDSSHMMDLAAWKIRSPYWLESLVSAVTMPNTQLAISWFPYPVP